MGSTSSVVQWDSLHLELEAQLGIIHKVLVLQIHKVYYIQEWGGSPKLSLTFKKSIKVREHVIHLSLLCGAPQWEVCKIVKVKSVLQCEPQGKGNMWNWIFFKKNYSQWVELAQEKGYMCPRHIKKGGTHKVIGAHIISSQIGHGAIII